MKESPVVTTDRSADDASTPAMPPTPTQRVDAGENDAGPAPGHGLHCGQLPACDETSAPALPLRLSAGEFGDDVRFLAIAGTVVLAEQGSGPDARHLVLDVPVAGRAPAPIELPALPGFGELTTKALDAASSSAAVLRCDANRCALSALSSETGSFDDVAAFELASLAEQRIEGVVVPASRECEPSYSACVYGSGLHCLLDGEFTTRIAPAPGQQLRGVAGDWGCAADIVVGDGGLLMLRDGERWERMETGTDADLVAVDIREGRYTASSADGVMIEGNALGLLTCDTGEVAPIALERVDDLFNCLSQDGPGVDPLAQQQGLDTHLHGITRDGRLVSTAGECSRDGERWSCSAPFADAIGWSLFHCGAGENPTVLTEDAVYGLEVCPLVP
ncbi:MAG: hypothetical protein OEZ06_32730 [Myxococcales bacterium]|nr:hypothetical protein [Myxococcales bacterium]